MNDPYAWLNRQLDEHRTETNSTLGLATCYRLKRWEPLTVFLREPGAPLDNNICERAIKLASRFRKNFLFYKTLRSAKVGDTYMSLIHTCNLTKVDPIDYLTQLQLHAPQVIAAPREWLPWNYQQHLARSPALSSIGAGG